MLLPLSIAGEEKVVEAMKHFANLTDQARYSNVWDHSDFDLGGSLHLLHQTKYCYISSKLLP